MNKYVILCTVLCISASQSRKINYHKDPIYRLENNLNAENGQYKFGFESTRSARDEVRGSDGVTRGFYTYIDDQNEQRHVEYTADGSGFRVLGGGLTQTPEVAAATKAHLIAYNKAKEAALSRPNVPQKSRKVNSPEYDDDNIHLPTKRPVTQSPIQRADSVAISRNNIARAPENLDLGFQKPIHIAAPVTKSRNQKPTVIAPEELNLFSTSSNDEPCHGPLCKLKYQGVELAVVTEKPRHQRQHHQNQHGPEQHHQRQQQSVEPSFDEANASQDYRQILIEAAMAYAYLVSKTN